MSEQGSAAARLTPEEFASKMVTSERMWQSLKETKDDPPEAVVVWLLKNIDREGKAEMEASGFTILDAVPAIVSKCRAWCESKK